ncbi:hypothetical protein GTW43_24545, partial [Streptomyces sp. SID5785]|nr:hypothetical protein [Streptomyces sp. SID5785]
MQHRPTDESVRFLDAARAHPVDLAGPEPGRVDPAVLGALLGRHGWQRRGGAAGRYARWTLPGSGPGTSLLVPESRA